VINRIVHASAGQIHVHRAVPATAMPIPTKSSLSALCMKRDSPGSQFSPKSLGAKRGPRN
jgi:hypothetical protein